MVQASLQGGEWVVCDFCLAIPVGDCKCAVFRFERFDWVADDEGVAGVFMFAVGAV